ncbi:MAG: glycosidase [Patescibacteria group bacterium]
MYKLTRHSANPILSPNPDFPWESAGVLNPGVIRTDDGIVMLYRAVGERQNYISRIGMARSKDGVHFERVGKDPVYSPKEIFDKWGAEDPRITKIDDDYLITYVCVPDPVLIDGHSVVREKPLETSVAILKTKDFKTFENLGVISPPCSDNKDIVLFPRKINGMYAVLHRPNHWNKVWCKTDFKKSPEDNLLCAMEELPDAPGIWIGWSEDLKIWKDHNLVMSTAHSFDAKIGAGLPPIETADGWLLIYHEVEDMGQGKLRYSACAALLDLRDPRRMISKLPDPILTPEMVHEKNIIFPSGGFISDSMLYVYYGMGDDAIGLATGSLPDLLAELRKHL